MRRPLRSLLPSVVLASASSALLATAAHAQSTRIEIRKDSRGDVECFRDGRRVNCDSLRSERESSERAEQLRADRERDARDRADRLREERDARERESAREREWARETRERALERAREQREQAVERARVERDRARERADQARRQAEQTRRQQQVWADNLRRDIERDRARERARERERQAQRRRQSLDYRPALSLGGGADIRSFDDVNRYTVNAGVDFRSRFGLGVRPEVFYGWSDLRTERFSSVACVSCNTVADLELRSRSQVIGVNLNGTYIAFRGSPIRPYLLGGVGILTTRESTPVVTSSVPLSGMEGTRRTFDVTARNRLDFGLNAGAGMEFGRGPVRLFTELRYFLADTPSARGFSGMLPITAGLRF